MADVVKDGEPECEGEPEIVTVRLPEEHNVAVRVCDWEPE